MIRFRRLLVMSTLLYGACSSENGSTDETLETPSAPAKKGSAGGFTASLSADLAGSAAPGERTAGMATGEASAPPAAAGSASAGSATAGSASAGSGAGSAKTTAAVTPPPSPAPAAGSGAKAPAVAATPPPAVVATPAAKTPAPPAVVATPAAKAPAPPVAATPPAAKAPVVLTPELKAIQLSLLPNWKRDVEGAGTISLLVDVQSKGETQVFKFFYGYDDPRAPMDREAYKKFLTDSKILTVTGDRQRGAAWYVEGTDASGPAFRVLVTYGGKRLVCYGSLYKGSGFGDIRDEVIIQAKKICETIQL